MKTLAKILPVLALLAVSVLATGTSSASAVSALDLESQVGYELRPDTYSRFPTACEADGNHVSWMWRDVNNNTQGIATVTLP